MATVDSGNFNPNQSAELEDRLTEQWQSAADRFKESEQERDFIAAHHKSKTDVFMLEKRDRIELREELIVPEDGLALERILGTSDLIPINFLSRGLRVAKSICRIHIHNANGRPQGFGTGFLVAPHLLLTNHHVLPDEHVAARSKAEFDYEYDADYALKLSHFFELDPQRFFYNNKALDFALVTVRPVARSGKSLTDFGSLKLTERSGKALVTEHVTVIQHPAGAAKHITLRNNKILNRFDHFLHYEADTQPGSSGSPVFSDQWDVVALHHSGVPKRNSNGRIMKAHGGVWRSGIDPSDSIAWIANEGVRISAIFANLKQQQWNRQQIDVLQELGTFANSDLNSHLVRPSSTEAGRNPSFAVRETNNDSAKAITMAELMKMVDDEDVSEDQLAPYFTVDSSRSNLLDPVFKIDQSKVLVDAGLEESSAVVNLANWICKRSRRKAYKKRLKQNPDAIRMVSEGDSWFQYPFRLKDIIDQLMANDQFAIRSHGEAGDILSNMVARAEFMESVEVEQPQFFLASGGGNDLVDGRGIVGKLIDTPRPGMEPKDLIDPIKFASFRAKVATLYTQLFGMILRAKPDILILCHGYSYPIPSDGIWLGKPMTEHGIVDTQVQAEIIRIMMNDINEAIRHTAASFPRNVHYLDLRNIVPAHGWFDEFHPTNEYYGELAAVFRDKINSLL